jgi:hypothetical protein
VRSLVIGTNISASLRAEDEDEAVEAAAKKFRVSAAERHKIMVTKAETKRDE